MPALQPYDNVILKELRQCTRDLGKPAPALALSVRLGLSDRTTRHYLSRLEKLGLLHRPRGPKCGWQMVSRAMPAQGEYTHERLRQLPLELRWN